MSYNIYKNFLGAIVAGVFIGCGCIINAHVGGLIGAVLFATGLVSIIAFKLPLFTGIVAEKFSLDFLSNAWVILIGNVLGCFIMNLLYNPIMPEVTLPYHSIFILSCGTGVLMVAAYKSKNYLIAIMGVTLFIMCGWFHCIAEAGYGRMSICQWVMALSGNIIGGQIFRLLDLALDEDNKNDE